LYLWIQNKVSNNVLSSNNFADIYQDAAAFADVASGLLVIPVQPQRGDYLVLFRPEVKQVIKWGGDPSTAIQFEPDRKGYHPRNSFALWQQTVEQFSLPWHKEEQQIAESLRSFFYEFSTR
jgi:two-component system, chemotaxis family, sensor kinase Cph1